MCDVLVVEKEREDLFRVYCPNDPVDRGHFECIIINKRPARYAPRRLDGSVNSG